MQVRYMPAQTPAQAAGEPGSTPIILCFIESILPADSILMRSRAFALKKPPDNAFCRKNTPYRKNSAGIFSSKALSKVSFELYHIKQHLANIAAEYPRSIS